MNSDTPESGESRKQQGIDRSINRNALWIQKMRKRACAIALRRGCVSVDDLRSYANQLRKQQQLEPNHPNAWGGLFKDSMFVCVGSTVSKHPSNHGRRICLWGVDINRGKDR